MNRRSPVLIILSLILTLSVAACAPKLIPDGWIEMARAEVAFSTKRAVLPIPPSTPAVKRLIIVALVNDIDFTNIRVEFENGNARSSSRSGPASRPTGIPSSSTCPANAAKSARSSSSTRMSGRPPGAPWSEIWGDPK